MHSLLVSWLPLLLPASPLLLCSSSTLFAPLLALLLLPCSLCSSPAHFPHLLLFLLLPCSHCSSPSYHCSSLLLLLLYVLLFSINFYVHRSGCHSSLDLYATINSLLKHKAFFELPSTCEPAQQQALLATATPGQIYCLCNFINNCFRKRYVLSQKVIDKIRPYARHINKIVD